MPAKRKDQVLVNRNFLMILFALIIILMIVCAVLLGVVVSEKRSGSGGKEPIKIENNTSSAEPGTEPSTAAVQLAGIGTYKVNTTADALNMRAAANTEGEILTEIPKGSLITVSALNGDWGYTVYGSYSGWVNMHYLVPAAPAPTVSNAVPTT